MEPKFQTSFIPKKPLEEAMPGKKQEHSQTGGIFTVATTIIFVAALLSAGGVFAYQNLVNKQIADAQATLDSAISQIKQTGKAEEYVAFERKLRTAKEVLNLHHPFSKIFTALQSELYQNLWFTDFKYSDEGGKQSITVNGKSKSFATIAKQSDRLSKLDFIKNVGFYNFGLEQNGDVKFTLKGEIDWNSKALTVAPADTASEVPLTDEEVPIDNNSL